jgi:hypothetical protein
MKVYRQIEPPLIVTTICPHNPRKNPDNCLACLRRTVGVLTNIANRRLHRIRGLRATLRDRERKLATK